MIASLSSASILARGSRNQFRPFAREDRNIIPKARHPNCRHGSEKRQSLPNLPELGPIRLDKPEGELHGSPSFGGSCIQLDPSR
jgi:hypothetical protein